MKLKQLVAGSRPRRRTRCGGPRPRCRYGRRRSAAPGARARGWEQPQRPDVRWEDRDGYDRAVRDHRPFQYQGHWVNPVFDQGHQGWGFWLGPIWIPLL